MGAAEVDVMEFLIIVTIGVVIVTVAFLFPERDAPRPARREPETDPAPAADPGPAKPSTLEGALVVQLMSGEITGGQYRAAIARIAERDSERNPWAVPGNDLL